MEKEIIQLGLIGRGNWGQNYIKTLSNFNYANIKTVATKTNGNDWRDLCKDDDIKGIIVATPAKHHYEMTKLALENGKHVIVEKPFVYTGDEIDIEHATELEELAMEKELNLLVGNINLFNPAFQRMVEIFKELESEEPIYINSLGGNIGPFKEDYSGFLDYVPHDFAMLLQLIDDRGFQVSAIGNEHQASVKLTFDSGEAMITTGALSPQKSRSLMVIRGKDFLVYNDLAKNKLMWNNEPVNINNALPLNNLVASFVDAIRSGERRYSAGMDVMIMHLMYAAIGDIQAEDMFI